MIQITFSENQQEAFEKASIKLNYYIKNIKREFLKLSIVLGITIKQYILRLIMSYGEYSIKNIREKGFANVLLDRANRFFGLTIEDRPNRRGYSKINSRQKGRLGYKTIRKVVLFPAFLIIIGAYELYRVKKRHNTRKKTNIYSE